jgi:predicted ArsR family transcriptional regulator
VPTKPIDSRTHRVLSGVSRVAVLEVLRASSTPLDAQVIAERVGLHANTVRSHLDQLVDAGLVESSVQIRVTPGRPRLLFAASALAGAGPEDSYQLLAEILASGLAEGAPAPGEVAARAGRAWGHRIGQDAGAATDPVGVDRSVDRIVAMLDAVGFAPRLSDGPATGHVTRDRGATTVIELHRCPFEEVAREHTEVVCAVHLGLMQGALEQMPSPGIAVRLEPFARPGVCRVHLASVDGVTGGGAA